MRVLVIEDDEGVSDYVTGGLKELGHSVDRADCGRDGLFMATSEDYDVLIIDRMLPKVDGLTLLKTLRAAGTETPALFLSAMDQVADKVAGLKAGADDYLAKPFAFEELMARLEVMTSRHQPTSGGEGNVLTCQDLALDLLARTAQRAGQAIELQAREFKLLEYLLRHKGQVVTRTMLLEKVWDYHFDPQTNVIDVHISRLRQKIDKGFETPLIETVRGAGYRIRCT